MLQPEGTIFLMSESAGTFARFVAVGGASALIYAIVLMVLAEQFAFGPAYAAAVAYGIAIAFNYVAHCHWTYRTDQLHRSTGPRYLLLIALLFVVNVSTTAVMPNLLNISYGGVQLILAAVFAIVTFAGQSRWVFSRRDSRSFKEPL